MKRLLLLLVPALTTISSFAQINTKGWVQPADNSGFTYNCDFASDAAPAGTPVVFSWGSNSWQDCGYSVGFNGNAGGTDEAKLDTIKYTWGKASQAPASRSIVIVYLNILQPVNLTANPKISFIVSSTHDTIYTVFLKDATGDVTKKITLAVTPTPTPHVLDFTGQIISGKSLSAVTQIGFQYQDCGALQETKNGNLIFSNFSAGASLTTSIIKASDIGLSLYPNPSIDGTFHVKADNISVDRVVVSNINGVTEEFSSENFRTNLKGLLSVQIYTSKGLVSEKVIVQ